MFIWIWERYYFDWHQYDHLQKFKLIDKKAFSLLNIYQHQTTASNIRVR